MANLLVVDDEIKIREMICKYARYEGHEVIEACDGLEAVDIALSKSIDLIVMDIMMPNMDGFNACKTIKKEKDIPFIFLSALGEEYDKIHGFELGVDDYVVKPFSPRELMLRINAVLNRTHKKQETKVFKVEGLEIDFVARIVTVNDAVVNLSPKEYDLLTYLVENQGIALTREQLLQNVWGYDFFGDDRTLDTHIKLLRKNLQEYNKYVVTLRGVGYRFEKAN